MGLGDVWGAVKDAAGELGGSLGLGGRPEAGVDSRNKLEGQAGASGDFAQRSENTYEGMGLEAQIERQRLRDLASGKSSISKMQLGQALQQNLAAQQSMAAGAAPRNAAMAARTAAIQSGRLGAGLAGQQAIAGIQERQAAANALTNAIAQQRQLELEAALRGRNNAIQGYGTAYTGQVTQAGQPTQADRMLGLAGGIAQAGILKSDARAKHKIKDGEKDAAALLKSLKSYSYEYKDSRDGKGPRFGIMAQDLEKTKAGKQAVITSKDGTKMVHGGALASALAATLPLLDKRLAKLEKGR